MEKKTMRIIRIEFEGIVSDYFPEDLADLDSESKELGYADFVTLLQRVKEGGLMITLNTAEPSKAFLAEEIEFFLPANIKTYFELGAYELARLDKYSQSTFKTTFALEVIFKLGVLAEDGKLPTKKGRYMEDRTQPMREIHQDRWFFRMKHEAVFDCIKRLNKDIF